MTKAEPPAAVAAPPPEADGTESRPVLNSVGEARSVQPHRVGDGRGRGRIPVFLGVAVLAAAAVVAIILILSGSNDDNLSVNTGSTPTAVALTPNKSGKTEAKAAPAATPGARTASCDPIVGSGTQNSGKSYAVTSSATDGDPASCSVAHSVLLSALSGGGSTISGWHCTTQPSAKTIASCTSVGGRRIQARG